MKYSVSVPLALVALGFAIGACNSTKTNTSAQETTAPAQQQAVAKPASNATAASVPSTGYSVAKVVSVDKAVLKAGENTVGKMAPNYTWRGADGKEHSLADYRGKTVLLNFWATWCPPCRRELPDIVNIHKSMDPEKFAVIGVSLDEEVPEGTTVTDYIADFSKRNGLEYSMMIGNRELVVAYGGIAGIPTTFIINPQGKITDQMVGGRDEATFRKSIEAAM